MRDNKITHKITLIILLYIYMKYKIIYSTGGSIMSNFAELNSELSQKWIPVSNHKKKKEWKFWDISRSFRHDNREYF